MEWKDTKMGRELPGLVGRYFEDFEIGDRLRTAGRTITETDIVNFMGLSGVFEELHMNVEYIKAHSVFGRRVAPGPLTFIVAEGLAVMTGLVHHTGMALLSVNNLIYRKPVFCNDTIHVEMIVLAKRETSKPDRGIVTFRHAVHNQAGEVVLEMEKVRMIRRRPAGPAEQSGEAGGA
jgi:acyl dehydratase